MSLNRLPSASTPYLHPWEHITDELQRLDVMVEAGMQSMTAPADDPALDPFRGLVVTESEARQLLYEEGRFASYTKEQQEQLDQWDAYIASRVAATIHSGIPLPLLRLQRTFRLGGLEMRCFIAALAPEIDRKYEKLYAFLQDDMTSKFATVDLLLRLCCGSESERREALTLLLPHSPLSRALMRKDTSTDGTARSFLSRPIRVDERMISYVQQQEWRYDGALSTLTLYPSNEPLPPCITDTALKARLEQHIIRQAGSSAGLTVYLLHGQTGSGKTLQARYAAAALGRPLLEWSLLSAPVEEAPFKEAVERVLREAALNDAIPAFDRLHDITGTSEARDRRVEWLTDILEEEWGMPVFLLSERGFTPSRPLEKATWIEASLPLPEPSVRQRVWQSAASPAFKLTDAEAGTLAAKFRFTPGRIVSTVASAVKLAQWEDEQANTGGDCALDPRLLHRAGYMQVKHRLSEKAVKLEPKYSWEDLILPDEPKGLLRQACNRLLHRHIVFGEWGFEKKFAYGKGLSMLFTGPPGTGKTMSAMVMAREMDAELYRIDLSRMVSKYIGETEKNLHEIFEEAQQSGAILFFDEADSLFGKRSEVKDAHDKYANMETSYLLQKMEEYDGLTILATNFAQNLDDAFTRRIQFIVKYPFPDPAQREQLWRTTFPKEQPVDDDIDFAYLANTFDLAGGPIKNVVLTAAFLAAEEGTAIGMRHMIEAVKQEYKKTGKVLLKDRLGAYASLVKG